MAFIYDNDGTVNLFDYLVSNLISNSWREIDSWNNDKYKAFLSQGTSGQEDIYLILRQNVSSQYNLDISVAQTWSIIGHSSTNESSHAGISYNAAWKNWMSVDADRLVLFYEEPGTPDYYGIYAGLLKRVTRLADQAFPVVIAQLATNTAGGLGSNVIKILLNSNDDKDSSCNIGFMPWDIVGQNDWDNRFLHCPIYLGSAIQKDLHGELKGMFSTYASSGLTMQATMNDLAFTHFPYDGSNFSARIYALLNE